MKSLTFRGACGLLPLLLMAQELSLTAAAARQSVRKLCAKRRPCMMQHEVQALGQDPAAEGQQAAHCAILSVCHVSASVEACLG